MLPLNLVNQQTKFSLKDKWPQEIGIGTILLAVLSGHYLFFEITSNNERTEAIAHLRLAIELAGDGGMTPFTDVEYELMYRLLNEMSTND